MKRTAEALDAGNIKADSNDAEKPKKKKVKFEKSLENKSGKIKI